MKGLVEFTGGKVSQVVGKIACFPRKSDFLKEVISEYGNRLLPAITDDMIVQALVRYYPKGNQYSKMEHGDEGVYMFTDKGGIGTFNVWSVDLMN